MRASRTEPPPQRGRGGHGRQTSQGKETGPAAGKLGWVSFIQEQSRREKKVHSQQQRPRTAGPGWREGARFGAFLPSGLRWSKPFPGRGRGWSPPRSPAAAAPAPGSARSGGGRRRRRRQQPPAAAAGWAAGSAEGRSSQTSRRSRRRSRGVRDGGAESGAAAKSLRPPRRRRESFPAKFQESPAELLPGENGEGDGGRTGEDADRKRRRERRAGGAQPSAAEVVPPLGLLAPCAARGRDGPRPPPGRARAQPGRAEPSRSEPLAASCRVARAAASAAASAGSERRSLAKPALVSPPGPELSVSLLSPVIPAGQYLKRQVEAQPEESRRFALLAGSTVASPGRAAAAPEEGKQCQGSGELPSDCGSPAWPQLHRTVPPLPASSWFWEEARNRLHLPLF